MNETLDPKFSNDAPVASNLEDRLNRTAFASQIGDILASLPLGTSLTVGIHGPWGDGKTSVLNLVKAGLSERPGIVYTDFNPWRMTNEEAMFRGFIDSLADGIGKSLSTKTEQVIAATSKWSLRFRRFTKVFGFFSTAGKTADELLQKLGEVAVAGDSVALDELRTRIVSQLSASNIRIVVFIDDIDRLDKHEICTLFRLVKACADFPNVCYVLAFDDEAVSSALGEIYPGGSERAGRAFLEKIIQVPLKLPVAARDDLRSLCMEQVDRALKASEIELSQDQIGRFASAFDQGASARFDTPRAGKRYGNALMFVLPILKGEVNIVDLLLLEALRAFYPEIYDFVRAHHEDFSGIDQENRGKIFEVSPPIQSLQKIFIKMDQKTADAAKSLLGDLFPRCQAGRFGSDWLENWAKGMRVCSPAALYQLNETTS